ncbi:MAG: AAA family ATPase [Candidatus Diapherotrites archaeon]|nr:AAA family ATPase [Candidatus Diapherotrites archaeon]
MIIGLCGPAQSGKDTVAAYMAERYGFVELSFSRDVLDAELKRRGKRVTKLARMRLGDELRENEGMDALAKRLLLQADRPRIVISNFRSPQEVEFIRGKTPSFHMIFIDASLDKRFSRRSSIDPRGLATFKKRDEIDAKKKGMDAVFIMADYVVDNNGTLEDLYAQVDEVMASILKESGVRS